MSSQIKISGINIDISPSNNKTYVDQCEHFTMRGYVAEMRKKDWKKCCPFPINVLNEDSLLPPLEVPKFKRWDCENCRRKIIESASNDNHNEASVNSDTQKASSNDNILDRREIDLNQAIDLSHDNEGMQNNDQNSLPILLPFQEGTSRSQVNNNIGEGFGQSLIKDLEVPSTNINKQNSENPSMMVDQVDGATMEIEGIQENKMERDFDLNCPCIIDLDEEDDEVDKNPLNLNNASSYTTGFSAQIPKKTFNPNISSPIFNTIASSKNHGTPILGQSSNYFPMSHLFNNNNNNSHYNFHSPPLFGESSSSTTHAVDFSSGGLTLSGLRDRKNMSHLFMKNSISNQFSIPKFGTRLEHNNKSVIRENFEPMRRFSENNNCMYNKNPADFSAPGAGNPHMINGEDL